jgi:hypothetical protein
VHGAIGSDRPSSRQKQHIAAPQKKMSTDSYTSATSASSEECLSTNDSFAAVFKNGGKNPEADEAQRKAPMLVLTSADKRKNPVC